MRCYNRCEMKHDGMNETRKNNDKRSLHMTSGDSCKLGKQSVRAPRAAHARSQRRTNPNSDFADRYKRYEEYETIKRRQALADTIRRGARRRKREKATKKALARQAQTTVRRKQEIQRILSRKAPGDTIKNINAFLGMDRFPQAGGKRKPKTKRRRRRRGGMHQQKQPFKYGDKVYYTTKRGEIGDGVREQWNPAVVPDAPTWGNIAHPTHIKLWKGDGYVFADRANVENTADPRARRLQEQQRASKRLRIRESNKDEQARIDVNKRTLKAEQRAKEVKAKYGVTPAERDESLRKMLADGKRRTQKRRTPA